MSQTSQSESSPRIPGAAYIRYSSEMQSDSFSLDAQLRQIKEQAERDKVEIVKVYADPAQSAYHKKFRPGVNDMREAARPVGDLNGQYFRHPGGEASLGEGIGGFRGLVHDEAEDAEIGGIGYRDRPEIDARVRDQPGDVGEPTRLVLEEHGNLLDTHRFLLKFSGDR